MYRLQAILLSKSVPHILMICWIVFLGVTIWDHASRSEQPPLYDPLTYLQKGVNFWQNINSGKYVNPLNIPPVVRPPGTILMSSPFGYSVNFHWFHFRSVFFPLICVVAAVYMAAGKSKFLAARWGIVVIALLFSSLPMFYHFEGFVGLSSPVRFGLVDNFQAGVAAMAAAAFVRSLTNGSLRWLCVGAGMAAFTLLIKPSGGAVMALLGLSWAMVAMLEWFEARKRPEDFIWLRRHLLLGFTLLFVIYSMVIAVCVKSQYLSAENFLYAKKTLAVAKNVLAVSLSNIPMLIHSSTGEVVLVWVVGIVILFGLFWHRFGGLNDKTMFKMVGFLASATIIWSGGICYWLVVQAGINQIRYFFPFFSMGIVFMVPLAVLIWRRSNKWVRLVMVMVCFLPAGNMSLLLVQKNPSVGWQKATGVSVSIGTNSKVVKQAYDFLKIVRRGNVNANVYSFSYDGALPEIIFENVGLYERIAKPDSPTFDIRVPKDWVRGFVIRMDDLLLSDYILFQPVKDADEIQSAMRLGHLQTYRDEIKVFKAWFTLLTEQDGIKVVSDDSVRLLEITDHALFEHQIERFISAHSWRSEFEVANPRRWWNASEVASYVNKELAASDIRFGDLYKLHAMALSRSGKDIKIEFWWEELRHEDCNRQRRMFFHFVDSEGRICSQQQISLAGYMPPHQDRRWRYGAIKFDPSTDSNISALAFGVWHPDSKVGILMADKGVRDWKGRRVVIPIYAGKEKN
jgi:hypothetical protein